VERAEPVPELEQVLVVDGEERPLSVANTTARRRAIRWRRAPRGSFPPSSRPWKRLAADEEMRNPSRLDRVDVGARHVVAEADEARNSTATWRGLKRHARLGPVGLFSRTPSQPLFSAATRYRRRRVGQRSVDRLRRRLERRAARAVRLGTGSATIAGCESSAAATATAARSRPARRASPVISGERRVHEALNRRHAAIARRQLQHAPPRARARRAPPVRADVGAAEPIDRLLRIADDEELAADVVWPSEQQDLGLDRIGVLELVDEDARELLLQVRAHASLRLDQIARARQQVGEVERAGRLLER
jgi:hypothetical protein